MLSIIKFISMSLISSPHRRANTQSGFASPAYSKKSSRATEFDSWSILVRRHRYLLTAISLLTFLCTVYLYFAVTLGATDPCSGLSGKEKNLCHLRQAKELLAKGKLKHLLP